MSTHNIKLDWTRTTDTFDYDTYNREHTIDLLNGETMEVSAAPEFFGCGTCADPEQLLVAALCSCHALTFWAYCAKKRLVLKQYSDSASGTLEMDPETQKLAITSVQLQPKAIFEGTAPTNDTLRNIHEKAHAQCFIANSVRTTVSIDPIF